MWSDGAMQQFDDGPYKVYVFDLAKWDGIRAEDLRAPNSPEQAPSSSAIPQQTPETPAPLPQATGQGPSALSGECVAKRTASCMGMECEDQVTMSVTDGRVVGMSLELPSLTLHDGALNGEGPRAARGEWIDVNARVMATNTAPEEGEPDQSPLDLTLRFRITDSKVEFESRDNFAFDGTCTWTSGAQ